MSIYLAQRGTPDIIDGNAKRKSLLCLPVESLVHLDVGLLIDARIKYGQNFFEYAIRSPPDASNLARTKIN